MHCDDEEKFKDAGEGKCSKCDLYVCGFMMILCFLPKVGLMSGNKMGQVARMMCG